MIFLDRDHRSVYVTQNSLLFTMIYLVTLESGSVFHVWGRTQGRFAIFRKLRSHRCCPQCHTMLKSNRVEPEIKMADVIPETHTARSADLE